MGALIFFQGFGVGSEMAVVDDRGGELRFLQRDVEGIASAHAPANRTDAVFLHVGLRFKKLDGGVQVAFGAVFGTPRMSSCAISGVVATLPR